MIFTWLVLLFVFNNSYAVFSKKKIEKNNDSCFNTKFLVVLYRTSTNKRRRGDQRWYSDRDHVNWSERQHGDDS